MNKWFVKTNNNYYKFFAINDSLHEKGISKIVINILENQEISVSVEALNVDAYKKILEVGKLHAAKTSESSSSTKRGGYYFDSTYSLFEQMTDRHRKMVLSNQDSMISYLQYPLEHYQFFNDSESCAKSITEALAVLVKIDINVAEIIEYMEDRLLPKSGYGFN